ncbi:guanylin [Dasypus novemcinctus]|uniref:guanylin n=1 Tax=Dasypus novemcinctus TaxID=9361 RepID=UPI0000E35F83|nr:guanylin [Dasypus novemcinctus]
MNTFLLAMLCLFRAWAALAGGVTVQDGDFTFDLESVKKLKGLRELEEPESENLVMGGPGTGPMAPSLCSHLKFPEELKPICGQPKAKEILRRLEAIAENPSSCEICAYAACAGC